MTEAFNSNNLVQFPEIKKGGNSVEKESNERKIINFRGRKGALGSQIEKKYKSFPDDIRCIGRELIEAFEEDGKGIRKFQNENVSKMIKYIFYNFVNIISLLEHDLGNFSSLYDKKLFFSKETEKTIKITEEKLASLLGAEVKNIAEKILQEHTSFIEQKLEDNIHNHINILKKEYKTFFLKSLWIDTPSPNITEIHLVKQAMHESFQVLYKKNIAEIEKYNSESLGEFKEKIHPLYQKILEALQSDSIDDIHHLVIEFGTEILFLEELDNQVLLAGNFNNFSDTCEKYIENIQQRFYDTENIFTIKTYKDNFFKNNFEKSLSTTLEDCYKKYREKIICLNNQSKNERTRVISSLTNMGLLQTAQEIESQIPPQVNSEEEKDIYRTVIYEIIESIFVTKQSLQEQLNRGEGSHSEAREVFYTQIGDFIDDRQTKIRWLFPDTEDQSLFIELYKLLDLQIIDFFEEKYSDLIKKYSDIFSDTFEKISNEKISKETIKPLKQINTGHMKNFKEEEIMKDLKDFEKKILTQFLIEK